MKLSSREMLSIKWTSPLFLISIRVLFQWWMLTSNMVQISIIEVTFCTETNSLSSVLFLPSVCGGQPIRRQLP